MPAAPGLTASDVIDAVREQNVQVAAGGIGQQPDSSAEFQVTVNAKGRLRSSEQFGGIIVSTGPDGQTTRLRDVARVELGADSYALRSLLNGEPAVALQIIQDPDGNALEASRAVRSGSVSQALRAISVPIPAGSPIVSSTAIARVSISIAA